MPALVIGRIHWIIGDCFGQEEVIVVVGKGHDAPVLVARHFVCLCVCVCVCACVCVCGSGTGKPANSRERGSANSRKREVRSQSNSAIDVNSEME